MLKAPMYSDEVGGLESRRRLGKDLYGDSNPAVRMFEGVTHKIESVGEKGEYMLRVPLGFAEKTEVDLFRSRDEITLRVGPYRRNIVLPAALHTEDTLTDELHRTYLRIDKPRMYRILSQSSFSEGTLELSSDSPGLQLFAFTFNTCV